MKTKVIIILMTSLILIFTGLGSYRAGLIQGQKSEAKSQKLIRQQALIAQQKNLQKEYQHRVNDANHAVKVLRIQKSSLQQQAKSLREKINYVNHLPTASSKPLPRCIFSNNFVSLWNKANGVSTNTVSTSASTTRTNRETTKTNSTDTPTSITRADLLENVVANGNRCQQIAAQLNALIDYIKKQGGHDDRPM